MKKIGAQQGDLILEEAPIPKGAVRLEHPGRFTLLKGEGVNTHDLVGEFEIYELDGVLYLNAKSAELVHAEHGTDLLPEKTYRRVVEREWDYETEETRETRD